MFTLTYQLVTGFFGTVSINMLDGVDGLAGSVSFISFIAFAILSYLNQQNELMLLSIALSGAVAGFLKDNWHPSRLFMGDSGSLSLGFSLVFLSIAITQTTNSNVPPVTPLLILTVPIVDTITVMIKRILKGKNPFAADKYHLHHILLRFGFSKKTTVKIISSISVLLSSIAIFGTISEIPEYYLFLIFTGYFGLYFVSSFYLKKILRWKLHKRMEFMLYNTSEQFITHLQVLLHKTFVRSIKTSQHP